MDDSILNGTKRALGLSADYTAFDSEIIMHINSTFGTILHQLGIGPMTGFEIEDASATWDSFLQGDKRLNGVKTYLYQKVRLIFDPPSTSFAIEAMQESLRELEWRLNVIREGVVYGAPIPGVGPLKPGETDSTFDGGDPGVDNSSTYDGGTP